MNGIPIDPNRLRRLFQDPTMTDAQAAEILGCSARTIRSRRMRYGITANQSWAVQRKPVEAPPVPSRRQAHNRKLLDEAQIEVLHNMGLSYEEIGRRMGCSGNCIYDRLRELGIVQPRQKKKPKPRPATAEMRALIDETYARLYYRHTGECWRNCPHRVKCDPFKCPYDVEEEEEDDGDVALLCA